MLNVRLATSAIAALFICCSLSATQAQENIQYQIPPSLIECYNTSYFMNRDNRLPATIDTLISLIEKIENSYLYNQDIRQTAVSLLHRFRQDGIQRAPGVTASDVVIPYSPTGFQFSKFRILLSRLIPGNALNFPNNTLTREERCSLHFMLSSSFDMNVRGDENSVCNQLSQYRAQRIPRSLQKTGSNNYLGDVEVLETIRGRAQRAGMRMNPSNKANEIDYGWSQTEYMSSTTDISSCPVENGVIWTPWGSVSAGTLIAGIAAGLQQQNVQLRTLIALARRPGSQSSSQTTTVAVDNRWAATLAGDLAEVALLQMPQSTSGTASVGANGGWNNTVLPKWYFLSQNQNLEMTDAEIRGGLDGLILAMNIANWRTQSPSMTLSQLLRMYYSMDGVLNSGMMACNRKDYFTTVAPSATMIAQASAFAQVLNLEMSLKVTLEAPAIADFSQSASVSLVSYVPQYMNDVTCSVSSAVSDSITPMTNIYVFLDTSWTYENVNSYLLYILQKLNINPYASSVTLLGAADGSIIVNTTNYLADVYQNWNVTTQATVPTGFNMPTILKTLQNLTQTLMNAEQTNNSVGGQSLVALLMPYMASISDSDSSYSTTQLQYLSEQVPDLYFIYYGGGSINRFSSLVDDPTKDLFSLSSGSTVSTNADPVVQRVKQIPRRIINPRCGASWSSSSTGNDQISQYARPGVTNFYRMAPNYFFGGGSNRQVSIQSQYSVQFTVCTSRTIVLPSQGSTYNTTSSSDDQTCTQLTGNSFNYDLSSACNGYPTIHQCPPLYLSVQAPTTSTQTVSCTDPACQTPDQLRYNVIVQNLGCYNGVAGIVASLATLIMALILSQLIR